MASEQGALLVEEIAADEVAGAPVSLWDQVWRLAEEACAGQCGRSGWTNKMGLLSDIRSISSNGLRTPDYIKSTSF